MPEESSSSSSSYAAANAKFLEALTALRDGKDEEALTLLGETSTKLENMPDLAALVHTAQSHLCLRIASRTGDSSANSRLSNNAVENAKKAASLVPNSLQFSVLHARLMYNSVCDPDQYEEVVVECERGLAIKNPVDHKEEEEEDLKEELRTLIQKSNIATTLRWTRYGTFY